MFQEGGSRHGAGPRLAAGSVPAVQACCPCSDARELWQSGISGRGAEDTRLDQEANEWGRRGGDPNRYRPAGLPKKY